MQLQKTSAKSGVTAKFLINFTSSAGSCNECKQLWNLLQQGNRGRKRVGSKFENYYSLNPFTHLSLGTSEGPKTCQAITQLHRSVHKIFCITLAIICAHYIGIGSTCVRWQQRKPLFWKTKSISAVAKPCPRFGKSDWEQQHLSIWSRKKV